MSKKLLFIIPSIIALVLLISILIVIYSCQTDIELEEGSVKDIFEIQLTDEEEQSLEEMLITEKEYIGRQPPEGYSEPEYHDPRFEFQLAFKDTYQSNIVIIPEEIYINCFDDNMNWIGFVNYEWLHLLSDYSFNYGDTVFFVAYGILTYYDGDVPYDYYVNLDEDIHNSHPISSVIFEVQTHGERPLNICLDLYNIKIRVEEGIKQKNPNCEQGCCD